nr:hypothetical protein [Tanacetum cinerariifolium]
VSAAATTVIINDINLAKALEALRTSKTKIRGIVIKDHEEPSESRTTTKISSKNHRTRVGLSARVKSFDDEGLGKEDASKQGRKINDLDADEDITLVNDQEMFNANKIYKVSAAATTVIINDINLAKALEALRTSKTKIRGIDKGKAKMIEEPVKLKKKDQILFDEEVARKLQEEINKEKILVGKRARQEEEANIELIETWEDIQAKVDADYQLAEWLQAEEQQELNE